jgi:hypothetical protein
MIEVLEFMVPIAARTDALKTKIGQRQPATTKTSIEQAERDAKAMTCQVCDRGILAETGCIAHHGYTRPGTGYQTNSCEGARAVPLEISRDGLGHHIKRIKTDIQSKLQWQDDVENERIGISWSMEDRTQCTRMYETGRTVIRTVKRETFDQVKQDTAALRKGKQESVTFDTLKARLMKDNLTTIDVLRRYLAQQEGRYNAWVGPTHEWNETNKTWSMLDMAAMSPAAQQKMADKLKTMQFDQPVAVPTDPDGMPAAATPETSAGMPTPTRRRMR